jgi:hypothetical protein
MIALISLRPHPDGSNATFLSGVPYRFAKKDVSPRRQGLSWRSLRLCEKEGCERMPYS